MKEAHARAAETEAQAAHQGIEKQCHFQAQLLDEIGEAVIATDPRGVITYWNRAAESVYGWRAEEAVGRSVVELILDRVPPEQRREVAAHLRQRERWSGEVTVRRQDGSTFPVLATHTPLCDSDGLLVGTLNITTDISERKRTERALAESEERYRLLVETSPDGVALVDFKGIIVMANPATAHILGYDTPEAICGRPVFDFLIPDDHERGQSALAQHARCSSPTRDREYTVVRPDGSRAAVQVSAAPLLREGRPESVLTVVRDVTDRKRFEEQLEHRALHDDLTDLPNRSLFTDRLQQAILTAARESKSLAVMILDLDRFKEINDALGHHAGDQVLRRVSALLEETLRDSDTVARFGGDEFAVLLTGTDEAGAIRAAAKLAAVLARPLDFEGQMLYVEASIGIALFPSHGSDSATLLQRADVAMYQAKRMSSGYAVYRPAQDQHTSERLALIAGLRHAIDHGELVLHYQPKVIIAGGTVEGAEALVRWNHPKLGLIPPCRFIGLAEQTGLIRPLTLWVLAEAIAQGAAWRDAGFDLHICLNLSVRNLHDPELVPTVDRLLRKHNLDPSRVVLEITETALSVDPHQAQLTVERLAALGVMLSIDDFGTGYSSLAYLHQLPVHRIKIDRSFVLGMMGGGREEGIVRSIIDLGHNLGLHVVAEGVETREVLEHLGTMGCDAAQGYYLSHPLPAEEFMEWMVRRHSEAERTRHVVVVEDQADVLRSLSDLLEMEGYAVTPLSHPRQLDKLHAGHQPDLFIIDIMLPEVSGIEVAERLREDGYPAVPMVAVSASPFMARRAQKTELFQAVLDKPFELQALLNTVADLVA